jgi:hypothetical protein
MGRFTTAHRQFSIPSNRQKPKPIHSQGFTMQDFLTLAIEAIAIASTLYLVAGFAAVATVHKPVAPVVPATAELPTQEEVDAVIEALTLAAAPLALPVTLQPLKTTAPDWAAIAPTQLRKECTARAIKWRNAHGKNRHMKKFEMVAALEA